MSDAQDKHQQLLTEIGRVEANLAFFDARFALIENRPDTAYKRAQMKAYLSLKAQLKKQLEDLQLKVDLRQARKKTTPA